MFETIEERLQALAVATSAAVVQDYSKVAPHGTSGEESIVFMSRVPTQNVTPLEAKLRMVAAIDMIYSVKDNLKALVRKQGGKDQIVEDHVKTSLPLQVAIDLHNTHKHGDYRPGERGHSNRGPKLTDVHTAMRLSSGPVGESSASVTMTPAGLMAGRRGSGSVAVVITGSILDDQGGHIGEIADILDRATADWERFAAGLGINVSKAAAAPTQSAPAIDPKAQEAINAAVDAGEDFVLLADDAQRKIFMGYRSGPLLRSLEWPVEAALAFGKTILAAARANSGDEFKFRLDGDIFVAAMPAAKAVAFFAEFVELCVRVSEKTAASPALPEG